MKGQTHGGKGSAQRPVKSREEFEAEWDRIFAKAGEDELVEKIRLAKLHNEKERNKISKNKGDT